MATTNDRILIGTRKGLFEARRVNGTWKLGEPALMGQPIAYAVRDPRNGALWASIDHGHWGVKLSRKRMFFSSDRARRELGYSPRPAHDAFRDAVAWLQAGTPAPQVVTD